MSHIKGADQPAAADPDDPAGQDRYTMIAFLCHKAHRNESLKSCQTKAAVIFIIN